VEDSRVNLFLVSGTDDAAIAKAADELCKQFAGENPDPFALDVIREGDNLGAVEALQQTVSSVLSPAFLGGQKTVWLKNFSSFAEESKQGQMAAAFQRLNEIIEKGVPGDIVLILSGIGIDRRKKLYKNCSKKGSAVILEKPNVRDQNWRPQMTEVIRQQAERHALGISADIADYLVDVVGTDTGRVACEIEKLAVYAGERGTVSLAEVQELCHGDGEAVNWALRDAVGQRNLDEALTTADVLLRSQRDAEGAVVGLVLQLASHVRDMLQARLLMQEQKLRSAAQFYSWLQRCDDAAKAVCRESGLEVVTYHPYRARMIAEQALKYTGNELVAALEHLRDAHLACVSASVSNRIVLDEALVAICRGRAG
jgi:DNA polymerase-3 subunit delta